MSPPWFCLCTRHQRLRRWALKRLSKAINKALDLSLSLPQDFLPLLRSGCSPVSLLSTLCFPSPFYSAGFAHHPSSLPRCEVWEQFPAGTGEEDGLRAHAQPFRDIPAIPLTSAQSFREWGAGAKAPLRFNRIFPSLHSRGWSHPSPAAVVCTVKPSALYRKLNFALLICLPYSLVSSSQISGRKS